MRGSTLRRGAPASKDKRGETPLRRVLYFLHFLALSRRFVTFEQLCHFLVDVAATMMRVEARTGGDGGPAAALKVIPVSLLVSNSAIERKGRKEQKQHETGREQAMSGTSTPPVSLLVDVRASMNFLSLS